MNLELLEFDINFIKNYNSIICVGSFINRTEQENYLIKKIIHTQKAQPNNFLTLNLLYQHCNIPNGIVISENKVYEDLIPNIFIHTKYTEQIISNFLHRQINIVEEFNKNKTNTKIDPQTFLILDNCINENSLLKNENIQTIFKNSQCYNIFCVLIIKNIMKISINLLHNTDYIFIPWENISENIEKIYECCCIFLHCYSNTYVNSYKKNIHQVIKQQSNKNYEYLVINNTSHSKNIIDKIFWYNSNKHIPDFKMGSYDFWDFSAKM